MNYPAFSVLREGEEQKALDVLVTAFTADPVIRWMYPDATAYLTRFPAFLRRNGSRRTWAARAARRLSRQSKHRVDRRAGPSL